MSDALEDHAGTVRIGGRTITNSRFSDDINGLAREKIELVSHLDRASTNSGMKISAEKKKRS